MQYFYQIRRFSGLVRLQSWSLHSKKGSKTNPANYKAISLLPIISKIIEKLIHKQTSSFLSNSKSLYNYQSGFWKNHSTDSCLTFLHCNILKGFDKDWNNFSNYTVGWFKLYLSNRLFRLNIENCYLDSLQYYIWGTTRVHSGTFTASHIRQ